MVRCKRTSEAIGEVHAQTRGGRKIPRRESEECIVSGRPLRRSAVNVSSLFKQMDGGPTTFMQHGSEQLVHPVGIVGCLGAFLGSPDPGAEPSDSPSPAACRQHPQPPPNRSAARWEVPPFRAETDMHAARQHGSRDRWPTRLVVKRRTRMTRAGRMVSKSRSTRPIVPHIGTSGASQLDAPVA
jgi:hypothetical protein